MKKETFTLASIDSIGPSVMRISLSRGDGNTCRLDRAGLCRRIDPAPSTAIVSDANHRIIQLDFNII